MDLLRTMPLAVVALVAGIIGSAMFATSARNLVDAQAGNGIFLGAIVVLGFEAVRQLSKIASRGSDQ